jgi:5-methylcytosine-specific restriction enzyme A
VNRALRICRKTGCSALVKSGYCLKHTYIAEEIKKESFSSLDRKKTPEQRAFYSSSLWTECSRLHREREPLCRRCKEKGIVKAAEMVHHNPARDILIARGDSPHDDRFLESLCNNCHLEELRKKK